MSDLQGTVKRWFTDRGYGFIAGDNGKDYFVHYSEIIMHKRRKDLEAGQRVVFDAMETEKGWQAVAVMPTKGAGDGTKGSNNV